MNCDRDGVIQNSKIKGNFRILYFCFVVFRFYMRKKGIKKFRKSIELFDENTKAVVRKITFRNLRDFEQFLEGFRMMRYPGYCWRYVGKKV